eukprot:236826-Ditylum_brightwellii.AAC.1
MKWQWKSCVVVWGGKILTSGVQNQIEQLSAVKMNMTIRRDTEAREDDTERLVSELDDDTTKAAFGILSEATGR